MYMSHLTDVPNGTSTEKGRPQWTPSNFYNPVSYANSKVIVSLKVPE